MAGRHEPFSEADGNEAETAGDSASQADEFHVQVSDLRRLPTESAAFAPLPWRQQRVQLPRPVVDIALTVTLVSLLLVATPIGSALVAFAAHPAPAIPSSRIGSPTAMSVRSAPLPFPTPTLNVPTI